MTKISLYFGSYNPIHSGHIAIAKYVLERGLSDEVWFVVSPANPLKTELGMAPESDRLAMVERAVEQEMVGLAVKVCDIEFSLPKPSYTVDTLRELEKKHPEHSFSLVVGTDIVAEISRWKEYQRLIAGYDFLVYPREGYSADAVGGRMTYMDDAPRLDHSSTAIRSALALGEDVGDRVNATVVEHITEKKLYTTADRVVVLNEKIEHAKGSEKELVASYIERGKLLYKNGEFGAALNDFNSVKELDGENSEALYFVETINKILDFYHKDIYNP